jgi:hypothetical protein
MQVPAANKAKLPTDDDDITIMQRMPSFVAGEQEKALEAMKNEDWKERLRKWKS